MTPCRDGGGSGDHVWVLIPWQPGIPEHVGCRDCPAELSNSALLESYLETRQMVESGVAVIAGELEELRADVAAAAGELRVKLEDMPPGSIARRVVVANRLLTHERDKVLGDNGALKRAIMIALRAIKTHDAVGAAEVLEHCIAETDR